MQLIADSGSTKTTWCLTKGAKIIGTYTTIGYNPHYHNAESAKKNMEETLLPQLACSPLEVEAVYYYGAGISTADGQAILTGALEGCFSKATLEVGHDLLAAARALCGHESGIACILGTGANSCYYDGKNILDNVDALGFFLGDEGGGANLGRLLIKSYYYRDMPSDIKIKFDQKYQLTKSILFENIFKKPMPNRYVAGFSLFCGENRDHPFIQALIKENFSSFIGRQVIKYHQVSSLPIHFVGSIAFNFQKELKEVLAEYKLESGQIIKEPINKLCIFHAKEF